MGRGRKPVLEFNADEEIEFGKMYLDDELTLKDVADHYEVSVATVRKYAKLFHLRAKKRGRKAKATTSDKKPPTGIDWPEALT